MLRNLPLLHSFYQVLPSFTNSFMVWCFRRPPFSRRLVQLRDRVVVPCFPCSSAWRISDQWSMMQDDPRWSKALQMLIASHRISSQSLGADPLDIQVHEGHSDPRPRAAHEGHWVSLKLLRHSRWKHKDTKRWIQANHKSHKTIDLLLIFFSSKLRLHSTTIPACLRAKQSFELKSSLGCFFLLRVFFTWSKKGAGTSVCTEETR